MLIKDVFCIMEKNLLIKNKYNSYQLYMFNFLFDCLTENFKMRHLIEGGIFRGRQK